MRDFRLDDMVKGWFVGDFEPTALRSSGFEVGVKRYVAGTHETAHLHKVATEITVLVDGSASINGRAYHAGDIILIEPGEVAEFKALTDVTTVVVKTPSAPNDKYPVPAPD